MEIKAVSNLARFRDIILILLKYGFGEVIESLDFPGKDLLMRPPAAGREKSVWERVRLVLEELGPTFIKAGQILSMRPDIAPEPLIRELTKLQDEVPPAPFERVREVVESELGRPLEEVFALFEETPLAAASLAQAHRAVLRSGQVVAVKVQRPGIREVVENDLAILEILIRKLGGRAEFSRVYDLPGLARQLRLSINRELNYLRESRHMRTAERNLAEQRQYYHIPAVYEELTTERVLTMELVHGKKLKEYQPASDEERIALARRGLALTVRQVLRDGFFHADPHPGNILIRDDGVICLLDWGMVGRLGVETRNNLVDLLLCLADGDAETALDVLGDLFGMSDSADRRMLEEDIQDITDAYLGAPLHNLNMGELLLELTGLLRRQGARVPADLAMMIKALITAEGMARQLWPELDVVREIEPQARQLVLGRFHPKNAWRPLRRLFRQVAKFQMALPRRVSRIMDKVEGDRLTIRFRHEGLEGMRQTMVHVANRLVLGVITAALLIASSMIITTGQGPKIWGYPAIGVIGYFVSALFGLWLVYSILRSKDF